MNRSRILPAWLTVGAALAAVAAVTAADSRRTNSSSKTPAKSAPGASVAPARSFESFQIVVERNIFNPNRVARTRSSADEKAVRVDELSLVGTVQHGAVNLALFDSPEAALRKAVHEGETIGEFTVVRITPSGAELRHGEKATTLKVAQQLRRVEGGEWTVGSNQAARSDPRALAAPDPAAPKSAETATSAAELPADASEVLKRLMKKREKQLNK